ncbi:hypothetical protein PFISCL1PPCAC_9600, partial [Pristionchus fissidentatus]
QFYINMVSFYARLLILRDGFISRKRIAFLLAVFVSPHVIALAVSAFSPTRFPLPLQSTVCQALLIKNSNKSFSPGIAYTLFYVCVVIYPAMGGFWKLRTMFIVIQLCEWRQPAVESISMMIGESPAIVSAIISLTHIPAYR